METNLLPCPSCNGAAFFEDDADDSLNLRVHHNEDCPMCLDSNGSHWSVWFYEEDFDLEKGSMREQVTAWWNQRYEHTCHPDRYGCCSVCGVFLNGSYQHDEYGKAIKFIPYPFCAHCGCRVKEKTNEI